jgi:hypothetical protein
VCPLGGNGPQLRRDILFVLCREPEWTLDDGLRLFSQSRNRIFSWSAMNAEKILDLIDGMD